LWAAVGAGLLVLSSVAFLLLPWNRDQTPQGARLSFLPFGDTDGDTRSGITPEMARDLLEQETEKAETQQGNGLVDGAGWLSGESGAGIAGVGLAGLDQADETDVPQWASPLVVGEAGGGVVAYVRSPVASYWRGTVYDTYREGEADDGEHWFATKRDDRRRGSILRALPAMAEDEQRYLQTFFAQRDLGDEILAGYEPLAVAIAHDSGREAEVGDGTVYQVISRQPEMSADSLRADRTLWQGREYAALPPSWGPLHSLAGHVVGDATTDFDKAVAIASYLRELEYAEDRDSPLESNATPADFLLGRTPGTAIDYATAMVLMSRSAGLPARLATGYLPGSYSAHSGAAEITGADAHAWAEIAFQGAGWVPFDAAPRPDIPLPATIGKPPPGGLSYLLNHRLGDGLADAIGRTPCQLRNGVEALLGNGLKATMALLVLSAGVAAGWIAYKWPRDRHHVRERSYDTLPGKHRAAMLTEFARMESTLHRSGFRRRRVSESFCDYTEAAGAEAAVPRDDLRWLGRAASQAAYSLAEFPAGTAGEARERVRRTRAAL